MPATKVPWPLCKVGAFVLRVARVSLPEPRVVTVGSKEERGGHVQWERFSSALDDSCVRRQWLVEASS